MNQNNNKLYPFLHELLFYEQAAVSRFDWRPSFSL